MAESLPGFTQWLFRAELTEDPTDFPATCIISLADIVPTSDLTFYTMYLSAHGALHIAIVIALLDGADTRRPHAARALQAAFSLEALFRRST